eukprot:NODE_7445_length_401_cov_19.744318_g5782_i0.p2 GENE.NODE_7445_length_401_cov_19.744318_g5782_i0~~NODE_7445_length_401_cov_19.744318_g5782_i0.p2  ORF type:complete len:66 (-),score=12.69 NODE_7445_length_401_cov_19.744318_g5782_i0:3-200(-)
MDPETNRKGGKTNGTWGADVQAGADLADLAGFTCVRFLASFSSSASCFSRKLLEMALKLTPCTLR